MRVKAYIPGTENVLVGEYVKAYSYIRLDNGAEVPLAKTPEWTIEPVIELPTKRDALIRYTNQAGFEQTVWRCGLDSFYPWVDEGGSLSDIDLLEEIKRHSDGKFGVIFEGTDN
jgi:hypothetical protein